jgi:hypothetical protein
MALASMFVGVLPLTMGIVYAIWPNEQRLTLMRTLSLATVFAAVETGILDARRRPDAAVDNRVII